MLGNVQHFARGVREWATPALAQSAFIEKGVLTPEEFVQAGDELVSKFPTWQWQAGDPTKTRAHLPPDKQYLLTRNVPCRRRARVLEDDYQEETEVEGGEDDDGEGWLATHALGEGGGADGLEEEFGEIDIGGDGIATSDMAGTGGGMGNILGAVVEDYGGGAAEPPAAPEAVVAVEDEYADMDDFEDDNLVQEDDATIAPPAYVTAEEPDDTILLTRTYDLTISYDKYYQTPRVWLFGYDESRQPLSQDQIYEDIMQDYAKRTVTIEAHPHLGEQHASIHPCQHSAVMKRIVDHLCAGGREPQITQYLFIFLKFIQSVIPTVDYDFTTEVEAGVTN